MRKENPEQIIVKDLFRIFASFRAAGKGNIYVGGCQRFFLRLERALPLGLCKVDQQNACTRRIPARTPMLSIPTSLTDGPRPATKD